MNKVIKQLYELGLVPGDVVLMHSSFKALGGGFTPEAFLLELMAAITNDGTLLLPALTYETVTFEHPVFSIVESEPCVGILPKTFAKMDGVVRSMHPTHSVCAWGSKAELLTRDHILDNTPVGPNSPFMLLEKYDGKLLFVGDILNSCTFMHGLEEIVKTPYVLNEEMTEYMLKDQLGNVHSKKYFTHDFKGFNQNYARIAELLRYPDIRVGNISAAKCTLIDAKKLKQSAITRFKEDIYAFVSRMDD